MFHRERKDLTKGLVPEKVYEFIDDVASFPTTYGVAYVRAGEIFEVNDPVARGTIIQRQNRIKDTDGENLKHTALPDVKLDIQMQRQQAVADRFKGGR